MICLNRLRKRGRRFFTNSSNLFAFNSTKGNNIIYLKYTKSNEDRITGKP